MWNVRKEMLLYLQKNRNTKAFCAILDKEVKLTEQCLLSNPKSYGSWHHRYWVLTIHPKTDWAKELKLCMHYLSMDDRNCKFDPFCIDLYLTIAYCSLQFTVGTIDVYYSPMLVCQLKMSSSFLQSV